MQETEKIVAQPEQINRIARKLPQFWRNNIQLWFHQVEAAFTLSNITADKIEYASLVASIDSETLTHVSDIAFSPPRENKSDALQARLIAEFADSENKRVRKLLGDLQLGDNKPTFLLRQMRELGGK